MDKDLLESVIEAEKEIQACIELERNKATEWLAEQKKSAGAEAADARREMQERFTAAMERAAEEAEHRAGEIVREAAASARALDSIEEERLCGVIRGHLHRILMG